jgi:hypothetical protein
MKKTLINITMALLLMGGFSSCSDYLDKEVDLSLSEDQIFSKYENTRGFLANVYTYLPDEFAGYTNGQFLAASRDCMTDNALSYWNVHYYHSVLNDSYDATNHYFATTYWTNDLKGIRAANQFMKNARESVIGNATKSGDDNKLYDRYIAEARLLRAIIHFDMASWFGAIPIIGDNVDANGNRVPIVFDPSDTEGMNMSRTSCAEAMKWIADECDAVKDVLPFRYANENENWGRMNGAAAYALKSRALLYRASALNNPGNDVSYWQAAAQAALDFITANNKQSNPYKLYTTSDNDPSQNYYQCFVSTPHLNNEFILCRSEWNTREIEVFLAPCGFSGNVNSVGRTNPTQNLVDSYEMANGLPIDDAKSGYSDQNPYANRDPRLEQTILHEGSVWGDPQQDEQRKVDVSYPDGKDYQDLHGGTTTGYYTKKFLNNMSFKSPTTYVHACPIFRYAEILLNAAEALNEAGQTDQAYQYVNQVRARVGMPAYKNMTQDKLRERIRNERRIELCFENHRFFDERRWKLFEGQTATSEKSLPRYKQVYNIYSVQVTPDTKPEYTYKNDNTHATRTFNSPKNYLFPIPDSEVKKAPNLKQNAGWELSASSSESTTSSN